MKLRFTHFFGLTLLAAGFSASAAESVPYSSYIYPNGVIDAGWTTVNNNRGATGWQNDNDSGSTYFGPIGATGGAKKAYDSEHAANCWLFSPAIDVKGGTEYTVSLYARTDPRSSYEKENFKVTVGAEATSAAQNSGTLLIDKPSYVNKGDFELFAVSYTPDEDGEVYFGINCYSEADQYTLFVTGFSVSDGSDEGGNQGGDEGDDNPGTDEPAEPVILEAPWAHSFVDFEEDELTAMFTIENHGETDGWQLYSNYYGTDRYFFSPISSGDCTDDFIATPFFSLEPGYYAATFSVSARTLNYELGYATDIADIAGSFVSCSSFSNDADEDADRKIVVNIPQQGNYLFVLRNKGTDNYNWWYDQLKYSAFAIEATEVVPAVATELSAVGSMDSVNLTWRNPSLNNAGETLDSIDRVVILRDGVEIATITDNLTPGELASYIDETVSEGRHYTYSVEVYNANGKSDEAAPDVTLYAGHGLAAGFSSTDFSDWIVLNNDDDYYYWEYDYRDRFSFSKYNDAPADDYALTPFIELEEGKQYCFTIELSTSENEGANPEFVVGTNHAVADLTKVADMALTAQTEENENGNLAEIKQFYFKVAELNTLADEDTKPVTNVVAGNTTFGVHAVSRHEVVLHSYAVNEVETSGVSTVIASDGKLVYSNGVVKTSAVASTIAVYALDGRKLLWADNTDSLSLASLAKGQTVVIAATVNAKNHTLKISL